MKNHLLFNISFYPNPTKDLINLSINKSLSISSIELFDITGRMVKSYNDSERKLNTEGLSSGQYILKIATEKGLITKKVQLE